MAERRRTKKAAEPAPPAAAEPAQPADSTPAAPDDPAAPDEPAGEEEPVFANRAERRAHARGKGAQQPKAAGKIEAHGRRGPVAAPRSWANRRSG
jgi:hypothetical protein